MKKVKIGDKIQHKVTKEFQEFKNEFQVNFWNNAHPIERKNWNLIKKTK